MDFSTYKPPLKPLIFNFQKACATVTIVVCRMITHFPAEQSLTSSNLRFPDFELK